MERGRALSRRPRSRGPASSSSSRGPLPLRRRSRRAREKTRGFLAELQAGGPAPERDRILATILFTDIVGSTARAAELGDARWNDLLERHHSAIRQELARYRGTEVETAGDGFFATFDGPARAIRCAGAIIEAVRGLGLEIRQGHKGECEQVDGKSAGSPSTSAPRGGRGASREVLVLEHGQGLVAGSELESTSGIRGSSRRHRRVALVRGEALESAAGRGRRARPSASSSPSAPGSPPRSQVVAGPLDVANRCDIDETSSRCSWRNQWRNCSPTSSPSAGPARRARRLVGDALLCSSASATGSRASPKSVLGADARDLDGLVGIQENCTIIIACFRSSTGLR